MGEPGQRGTQPRETLAVILRAQPLSIASSYFGAGDINELPDMYFTLDTGLRFFDEALTVGSIIKYTGKTRRLSPDYETSLQTGRLMKQV